MPSLSSPEAAAVSSPSTASSPVPSSSGAKPGSASVPTVTSLSPSGATVVGTVLGATPTSWICASVPLGRIDVNRTVQDPALGNSTGPE